MDLYELLGLARGATLIEIKRSYRRLARKYHPDINPGDHAAEAHFKEITRAYETLSDPEQRLHYDAGAGESTGVDISFEFEGFDFSGSGPHVSTTFGDLFAEVFSQRQTAPPGAPERGADLHLGASLTFEEALQGTERRIMLTRRDMCRSCNGAGMLTVAESRCQRCQGTGVLKSRRGHMIFSKSCDVCAGSGRLSQTPCNACGGAGLETRSESVTVRIPPGVADNARIRVPGRGHAGLRGGPPGDVLLALHVAAHETFRREGDDLHIVISLGVHEAALGARIEVPSPDGPARLRVPPGTQTGQRFRLRGRGAPSPRTGERGDLVVEVKLMLPRILDERSKELLREFGRINGEDVRREP